MTGELIPTGVTFGVGRNSINDAFSGTAYMNNIELDAGGNFSAGTGGGVIYSAGTDLYDVFVPGTSGNLWSASSGSYSIITNNGSLNVASGNFSIAAGYSNSATTSESTVIGGSYNIASSSYSSILGGASNTASGVRSSVVGGQNNTSSGLSSFVGGGELNSVTNSYSSIVGGYRNTVVSRNSVIIGGRGNGLVGENSVILGGHDLSVSGDDTAGMMRAYIDEYIDLNPQTKLPIARQGRMFFSGTPLFKLMINTGGTNADWVIV